MMRYSPTRYKLVVIGLTLILSIASGGLSLGQDKPARPTLPPGNQSSSVRPTDSWAVVLAPGSDPNAVAAQLGYRNAGRIGNLANTYLFTIRNSGLSAQLAFSAGIALDRNTQVVQFTQQVARQQIPRDPIDDPLNSLTSEPPQWHLWNNVGHVNINVRPTWDSPSNITGSGVQIAIVDDGLQHNHPDLQPNYNAAGSWDFNSGGAGDPDPSPVTNGTNCDTNDCHGTAAAGVAAAADNPPAILPQDYDFCGVGVAFSANLSGIRLIAGPSSDSMEASALTYQYGNPTNTSVTNDVYSNSWGPSDNGATLQTSGTLTQAALLDAVTNGRGGKGNIYVWAAGNGRQNADNINADGYANSRFVIAVGATGVSGHYAFYSEPGAPMLVTAPSNDSEGIATTDLMGSAGYNYGSGSNPQLNDCTDDFGGTSAAAPQVAGVAALMLQANPNLTWRDVQYILVNSAVKNDQFDNGWSVNGAGYHINHNYGFGLVDATAAVNLARTWTNVASEVNYASPVQTVNQPIPSATGGGGINRSIVVPANIKVEHVVVVFNAHHTWRGDIEVNLTSPSGTVSKLMNMRIFDGPINYDPLSLDDGNYDNWKFMTVRDWGELSAGTWTINVVDRYPASDTGTFNDWQIIVYGTQTVPNTPTVTAPANGTVFSTMLPQADVNLTWTNTNVFADHLELLLYTVSPPVNGITLPVTATNYAATLALGTYYWQIRAVDASGIPSALSPPRTFSIITPTNNAPIRNYFTTDKPTLTWNRVSGAIRYEIQVASDSLFQHLLSFSPLSVDAPTLSIDTPHLDDGLYYWRVRACTSQTKCGSYSIDEPFTVDAVP